MSDSVPIRRTEPASSVFRLYGRTRDLRGSLELPAGCSAGDAQAAQINSQAAAQDPDFFAFYSSLQAYRQAFGDGRGTIILKPDSEFLRYFDNPTPAPARH